MGEKLNAHLPWFTLMMLVTIESSLIGFQLPKLGLRIEDKIVHFLIFGILGWLLVRGMIMESTKWIRRNAYFIAVLVGFLFALSDEWHQSLVPGRDASVGDLLADILGIAFFIWYFYQKQRRKDLSTIL
ncbi:hypothetical protein DRI50_07350 [candidate division KSB1 bacterium]|nr:MAG: hypothetical protein DRI50_07350 [candidate division KSB1 bacterium]